MLKLRVITGVILLFLILAALFLLELSTFAVAMGAVVTLAAWEWSRFMGLQLVPARILYCLFIGAILAGLFWYKWSAIAINDFKNDELISGLMIASLVWWVIAIGLIFSYPKSGKLWREQRWLSALMGIATLVPTWLALVMVRGVNFELAPHEGAWLLLYVMAIIWVADIGAYFSGKAFGKTKLAPNASPGKTLEGAAGGLVACLIFAYAGTYFFAFLENKRELMLGAALVIAIFSIIGDLTESIFKREQNLKDSGAFLPGHGGILDRVDSLTAATPIFVLCYVFLEFGQ